MPERVCLHIGVAKTGTKTLQLAMALNGNLLRQHGFVYPELPGRHHVGLALYAANESTSARLRARMGLADGDRMAEFVGEFPSRLAAAVMAADIHTAILSNEHCSSELSTVEAISRLHALLSPLAREIRVIVYLRRQDDLAISLYSASVQAGSTNEFQFSDGHFWFDYSRLLDMWAEVFGQDNLVIRIFEPAQMHRGGLLCDFSFAIGFEPHDRLQHPPDQNKSLDIHTLEFLRRFNAHAPLLVAGRPNLSRGEIDQALAAISTRDRMAPSAEAGTEFLGRYAASNAQVAGKYLNRADRALFVEQPSRGRSERIPALDVDKAVEIAAKLWEWHETRFRRHEINE